MAWSPNRSSRSASGSRHGGPVFGIGRQAFVNGRDAPKRLVPLLDEGGSSVLGTLPDCEEVEILAWMPRGAGTRYCVRSTKDGIEGWLRAADLRATRNPPASGAVAGKAGAPVSIPPRMPVAPASPSEREAARSPQAVAPKRRGRAQDAPARVGGAGTARRR